MNENIKNQDSNGSTINLSRLMRYLLKRAWIILLVAVICATAMFCYSKFAIEPTYESSIMLYVNNFKSPTGSTVIGVSYADINASIMLVKTYIGILQNRTTLEMIIEEADLDYSVGQLSGMIKAAQKDETEIFTVTVTSTDPEEAAKIANTVRDVLKMRVEDTIEGANMKCVDDATVNRNKVAPSNPKNAILGFLVGAVIMVAIFVVCHVLDGSVHDEDYIIETYDFPVLANIPDFYDDTDMKYSYYSSDKKGEVTRS